MRTKKRRNRTKQKEKRSIKNTKRKKKTPKVSMRRKSKRMKSFRAKIHRKRSKKQTKSKRKLKGGSRRSATAAGLDAAETLRFARTDTRTPTGEPVRETQKWTDLTVTVPKGANPGTWLRFREQGRKYARSPNVQTFEDSTYGVTVPEGAMEGDELNVGQVRVLPEEPMSPEKSPGDDASDEVVVPPESGDGGEGGGGGDRTEMRTAISGIADGERDEFKLLEEEGGLDQYETSGLTDESFSVDPVKFVSEELIKATFFVNKMSPGDPRSHPSFENEYLRSLFSDYKVKMIAYLCDQVRSVGLGNSQRRRAALSYVPLARLKQQAEEMGQGEAAKGKNSEAIISLIIGEEPPTPRSLIVPRFMNDEAALTAELEGLPIDRLEKRLNESKLSQEVKDQFKNRLTGQLLFGKRLTAIKFIIESELPTTFLEAERAAQGRNPELEEEIKKALTSENPEKELATLLQVTIIGNEAPDLKGHFGPTFNKEIEMPTYFSEAWPLKFKKDTEEESTRESYEKVKQALVQVVLDMEMVSNSHWVEIINHSFADEEEVVETVLEMGPAEISELFNDIGGQDKSSKDGGRIKMSATFQANRAAHAKVESDKVESDKERARAALMLWYEKYDTEMATDNQVKLVVDKFIKKNVRGAAKGKATLGEWQDPMYKKFAERNGVDPRDLVVGPDDPHQRPPPPRPVSKAATMAPRDVWVSV